MTYSSSGFQLTHLLQRVYDKLEQTRGLVATGGSTTTIVDTNISDEIDDDTYKGWTAFVSYDAGGAGAAPEGEYQSISDYAQSTNTLTIAAFTVAIAVGDRATITRNSLYPLYDVRRLCNNALKELGRVPNLDTSLTTAADQTEYDIPATVQWDEIVKVEIQGLTSDANETATGSCLKAITRCGRLHPLAELQNLFFHNLLLDIQFLLLAWGNM